MINDRGELTTSIPKKCQDYNPDKDKPTGVKCNKLGILYEYKNYVGKNKGCLSCEKLVPNK